MRRVLLIGGYGGFGARIAPRLAAAGWEVLVAGRSESKAAAFCAGRAGLVPLRVDRDRDLATALSELKPFAVADATGPFQGASYEVPRACIAAGCHYVDIADGRDFVAGIGELDAEARNAGVTIVSGASSVPALSGAAVRVLSEGMEEVRAVELAISASNRATAGPSVTRAILSYVGKPFRIWRGRAWSLGYGWQEVRRETFRVAGHRPLAGRFVALADVPDLDLLPGRLPGHPAVTFRAGTEFDLHNRAMWLMSWLVRRRLLTSLLPLGPLLVLVQKIFSGLGSDRSGMIVRVFGLADGRGLERRWTLIAENGHGPEIPGLAVPIVLAKLARGEVQSGARDAGALLTLDEFEPAFAELSIGHELTEIAQRRPLYTRIMGSRFAALPSAVRDMHGILRDAGASGRARVARGSNPFASLVAVLFGFPPEGEHPVHVAFSEADGVETWLRDFGGHRFRSRLSEWRGYLVERFGPLCFAFDLRSEPDGLSMVMRRWWLGPMPLPLSWAPRSLAREWEAEGRFHFDVPIALPLIGTIVRYRGWLARPDPGVACRHPKERETTREGGLCS